MERALAIQEREYGPEHHEVAVTLTNLGNAHGSLGDALKQRELESEYDGKRQAGEEAVEEALAGAKAHADEAIGQVRALLPSFATRAGGSWWLIAATMHASRPLTHPRVRRNRRYRRLSSLCSALLGLC